MTCAPLPSSIVWAEISCAECGIRFCVDQGWKNSKIQSGKGFRCPNGCDISYNDSEVKRLKRELEQQTKRTEWAYQSASLARERARHQEHRARAYRGHLTRHQKRTANGVCPCCNRTFKDLARHMKTKHPQFVEQVTDDN